MTGIFTLVEFAEHLHAIEKDLHEVGPAIVARACQLVCTEAKRVLGEGYPFWAPLKPETLAHKMLNTPLLETGAMRASIEWSTSHDGLEGAVGSNSDIAVFQELGTNKIPPRSFLAGAAIKMGPKIERMAARAVMSVMAGGGLHSSEMEQLIHLLRHVGHAVKEAADTLLEGPDDEEKGKRR